MNVDFWQWVAMTLATLLISIIGFAGRQHSNRLDEVEKRVNEALPRGEFNTYAGRMDDKLDAMQDRLLTEFRSLHQRIDGVVTNQNKGKP